MTNRRQEKERVIHTDSLRKIKVTSGYGVENNLYGRVLKVRADGAKSTAEYEFDEYSYHYVMEWESIPIGSLTSTHFTDGRIDCAEYYPECVMNRYGEQLASTCKFKILQNHELGFLAFRTIVHCYWRDLLKRGVLIDLINIETKNTRPFEKIGYTVLPDSGFIHPTLGTDSVAMFMTADPSRKSLFQKIFLKEATHTLSTQAIIEMLPSHSVKG